MQNLQKSPNKKFPVINLAIQRKMEYIRTHIEIVRRVKNG